MESIGSAASLGSEVLNRSSGGGPDRGLPGQFLAENCGIAGERKAGFEIDHAVLNQLGDFTVEMLHAVGGASLHGLEQTPVFALPFFDALAGA